MKVKKIHFLAYFCCIFIFSFLFGCGISLSSVFGHPVALLAPGRPHPDKYAVSRPEKHPGWETDALISFMNPFLYENIDMNAPQMFAIYEPKFIDGAPQMVRRDLLADLEEIRYLEKKAWSANVALDSQGANILVLESKPWWDKEDQKYRQFISKSIIFLGNQATGWNLPTGVSLEIIPLVRPIGLYSPCIFSGLVIQNGKALPDAPLRVGHINESKLPAATDWHKDMSLRTDAAGQFSVVLNEPGWWYCEAMTEGEPLKGNDGELKEMEISAVIWLYIDPIPTVKNKRN